MSSLEQIVVISAAGEDGVNALSFIDGAGTAEYRIDDHQVLAKVLGCPEDSTLEQLCNRLDSRRFKYHVLRT